MTRSYLTYPAQSDSVLFLLLIGPRVSWEGLLSPVLPTQLRSVRALSAPAVTLLTGDWKNKKAPGELSLSN